MPSLSVVIIAVFFFFFAAAVVAVVCEIGRSFFLSLLFIAAQEKVHIQYKRRGAKLFFSCGTLARMNAKCFLTKT
jgi:hypothetical protein